MQERARIKLKKQEKVFKQQENENIIKILTSLLA